MHQTRDLDDGYMGSGKILKRAMIKYGVENFVKEILHVFDNEQEMKQKEKELVVLGEMSYNLLEGGHGGFGYINRNGINFGGNPASAAKNGRKKTDKILEEKYGENWRSVLQKLGAENRLKGLKEKYPRGTKGFLNRKHSQYTKDMIGRKNSIHQQGSNNSQYGTCWITNGQENKKIKKEELDTWLEKGYYKGRV
jgi:hypothetical protein